MHDFMKLQELSTTVDPDPSLCKLNKVRHIFLLLLPSISFAYHNIVTLI
jgi:hypothetical protein